jgi:hypothetical protein
MTAPARAVAVVGLALACASAPGSLQAQQIGAGAHAAWLTRQDAAAHASEWSGAALGGALGIHAGRWRGDVEVYAGRLQPRCQPSCPAVAGFNILRMDVRADLRLTRVLWVEVAATREHVTPEFAARDLGALQAGMRIESDLGRGADVWASAAVIPIARTNTQTGSGLGTEVGLGAHIDLFGKWRLAGSYYLRRVNRLGVQSSIASLGIGLR